MPVATANQWKQFIEGMGRGDVAPLTKAKVEAVPDRTIQYTDGNVVMASMEIQNFHSDTVGCDCSRVYFIDQSVLDATKYIYVPTDDNLEDWNDAGLFIPDEIAAREPVE